MKIAGIVAALAATGVFAQEAPGVNDFTTLAAPHVVLRGLDTLSGNTRDLELEVGETIRFGHLEIAVEACRVPQNEPESDAYAFLRIRDVREDHLRFEGWMFASSPALSALDHPRYDVWVASCSSR